jgi:hypothetical protein
MVTPAAGSKRIRINEHIEIGWEKTALGKQVRTFVDDKSDKLWEPDLELAEDPPIAIQRIYTWQDPQ